MTCDRIFNDATVVKLGEGASCEWPASETVQVRTPRRKFGLRDVTSVEEFRICGWRIIRLSNCSVSCDGRVYRSVQELAPTHPVIPQIVLAKDFSIAVGDSIFVREDTIYTQPREGAYCRTPQSAAKGH